MMQLKGFGLGLRPAHYEAVLGESHRIDWLEIITENYLVPGGKPLHYLERIRARFPVVMHGVSLSIGSTDPVDRDYLKGVRELARRIEPAWISDHLCWTGVEGSNVHDLLPLPYTEEALDCVVARVGEVQDALGRQILLENVSTYLTYRDSEMNEWEFLSEVARRADCAILLDINNIYVSAVNHDFDASRYLRAVPKDRVRQFHLAGHSDMGDHLIDTHDHAIAPPVWNLYREAIALFGSVPTMIERDDNIPPLSELVAELDVARAIAAGEAPGACPTNVRRHESPLVGHTPKGGLTQLRQLQRELQRDLFGASSAIAAAIAETAPLATERRLGIYRHAYRTRLTEALDETYAVLHQVLGDDTFQTLGSLFIDAHPSTRRSIRWYGRELTDFLRDSAPFNGQPILAEIARFEWTLSEAFDSADARVLARADLEAVDPSQWAELSFSFHPSVRRLTLEWNTVAVWKALSGEAESATEAPLPQRSAHAVEWLVWRHDLENYFRSIDVLESAALEAALRGDTFGEICAALGEQLPEDEVPLRAAGLIATWADGGILANAA